MAILALTRLHYGADYLDAVIRSTEGFAEKHIVVYTETPNFPGSPSMPCPDTRDELLLIAHQAGGKRLQWIEGRIPAVAVAFDEYDDIDLLLELDADEVLHQDLGQHIIESYEHGLLTARRYRLPMIHHWRAFKHACTDGQWPIRLYVPKADRDEIDWYPRPSPNRYIHHFGYVRSDLDSRYKWELSLHKDEMRPEFWSEIWDKFPERLTDLHPVSNNGFWNAEEFPDGDLPAALINHPYRYLEMVK
jgi:hypothetical protein